MCCFSRKDHIIVFAEEIEEEEYGILLSEKLLSKVIPTLKVVEMSVVAPSGPKVVQQAWEQVAHADRQQDSTWPIWSSYDDRVECCGSLQVDEKRSRILGSGSDCGIETIQTTIKRNSTPDSCWVSKQMD